MLAQPDPQKSARAESRPCPSRSATSLTAQETKTATHIFRTEPT